jgi:predicted dehydrogenase
LVRWGIAGPGDIAERVMAPAMTASPLARLVAVARRDLAAGEAFAARHGAERAYADIESLAADPEVDAIYIATPVHRHLPDAIAAAKGGKHVLCEKPLARNVEEAEAIRDACAAAGVTGMICFYQRFNARHRKIRELLAANAIGPVTAARWNFSGRSKERPGAWRQDAVQSGGGSFLDNGSHSIDLMRSLLGDVRAVTGFVDTLAASYGVEDTASAILQLENGAQVVMTSHWSTGDPDEFRNSALEIYGTEGAIFSTPLHDKFSRGTLKVVTAAGEETFSYDESTHVAVLAEFAAALHEGRAAEITLDDGVIAQRVVAALYESSKTGNTVRFDRS